MRFLTCCLALLVMLAYATFTQAHFAQDHSLNQVETQADDYRWNVGSYGDCNRACNGGIRKRIVTCQIVSSGKTVNRAKCEKASGQPAPVTFEKCNTQKCAKGQSHLPKQAIPEHIKKGLEAMAKEKARKAALAKKKKKDEKKKAEKKAEKKAAAKKDTAKKPAAKKPAAKKPAAKKPAAKDTKKKPAAKKDTKKKADKKASLKKVGKKKSTKKSSSPKKADKAATKKADKAATTKKADTKTKESKKSKLKKLGKKKKKSKSSTAATSTASKKA